MIQFGADAAALRGVDAHTLELVKSRFVRNVYAWMAGGLALTAVAAGMVVASDDMMMALFTRPWLLYALMGAELALVLALVFAIDKMPVKVASWAFCLYALLTGVTLSSIFVMYTAASLTMAFVTAAAVFGSAAAYGTFTKRDLTSLGAFAFMALIGLIIATVVNIFMAISALDWIINYAGVAIFTALAAYDAQKIQRIGVTAASQGEDALSRHAIMGALALYLDFINLFLFLVRIMGQRK